MKTVAKESYGARLGALFFAAFALCAVAIWNQQPFFYADTTTYLRGAELGVAKIVGAGRLTPWSPGEQNSAPADPASAVETPGLRADAPVPAEMQTKPLTSIDNKIVLAGRSVYYGVLLYAGYLTGGMWLAIVVQALCVAYVLHLLMVRLWGLRPRNFALTALALSALSPLGAFTGFLMPDIFAPLVILCFSVLTVYWARLARGDRWLLSALLLFGLSAHASHVALAALLLAVILALRFFSARWRGLSIPALLVVLVCLAGAVAAELTFNKAVTMAVGAPPLRLPHPMARLVDLGPGTAFLRERCADPAGEPYVACRYLQNYPTNWDDFLFSTDPAKGAFALADSNAKRQMSNEQLRFIADVLRYDPVGVISGVGANILHQLVHFRVDVWSYGANNVEKNYAGRVPDSIYAQLQRSRAATPQPWHIWLTLATYTAVGASLAWAAFSWLRRSRRGMDAVDAHGRSHQQLFDDFVCIVCTGVVANAIVCATLASSMDRFQARVIWLLPFMAACAFALRSGRVAASSSAHAPAVADLHPSPPRRPSSHPSLQGTTS
jgi:hypothetical protein